MDDQNSFKDARRLFRGWLELRRTEDPPLPLPADTVTAAWRVLLKMVTVVALLLGSATAFNLLRYDGTQPVNVATYLGWLVLVQIGLVAVALGAVLLRRTGWMSTETSLLTGLMRLGWSALAVRLNRHLLSRIPAERRTAVESFLGTASTFKQLYGGVTIWPLVGALQWFGVCFNLAAMATTVALVVFSDRAFGWQSAVNFSPEQIHQLTETLAAPWSGILPAPGRAHAGAGRRKQDPPEGRHPPACDGKPRLVVAVSSGGARVLRIAPASGALYRGVCHGTPSIARPEL